MQTIIFDIETGPLPETELAAMMPAFDPAEVKTGNLKDPAKIAEKIAEAEANQRVTLSLSMNSHPAEETPSGATDAKSTPAGKTASAKPAATAATKLRLFSDPEANSPP